MCNVHDTVSFIACRYKYAEFKPYTIMNLNSLFLFYFNKHNYITHGSFNLVFIIHIKL
jgi:hypothetical protein